MAERYHLNPGLRGEIVGMRKAGMSISSIARNVGVTRKTVRLWISREEERGNVDNLPRNGRPRKTTEAEDERIMEFVNTHPFTNAVDTTAQLNLDVSAQTVRRRWHGAGVHHRIPAEKDVLEARHIEGRLRFAQQYVGKDMSFWGRVVWTDEKTFSSSDHGQLHCWRPNNSRYDPKHIYEVARSGHVTVNMWGWINLNCVGELTEINGRFTAEQYIEILEEVMLPTVRATTMPYPEKIVFMQVRF